jgi:SAM-dependent methyltransferase
MSAAPVSPDERRACPICGADAVTVGAIGSVTSQREFGLARCVDCSYAFVRNPRTDFDVIYDAAYYAGRGADRLLDYDAEMNDPATPRRYEWRGISTIVGGLVEITPSTRWLDYGCGLGGLVRYVRDHSSCQIVGFEEGYAAERLETAGLPHVTRWELDELDSSFDVVTAIEVLEHALDPLEVLRDIRRVLVPGGLLFLTTGNAEPHRRDLTRWSYARVPDVHVGFFEPSALAGALERAGFEVVWPGFVDGLDDVIRFKVLKSLQAYGATTIERLLPWSAISRVVDRRYRVSAMPIGRRPA